MTVEPILILQEKGSKDAFNKKVEMADNAFTTMSCLDDLVLSTTSSVGLALIKVLNFLNVSGRTSCRSVVCQLQQASLGIVRQFILIMHSLLFPKTRNYRFVSGKLVQCLMIRLKRYVKLFND
jgi:hypothetical protein